MDILLSVAFVSRADRTTATQASSLDTRQTFTRGYGFAYWPDTPHWPADQKARLAGETKMPPAGHSGSGMIVKAPGVLGVRRWLRWAEQGLRCGSECPTRPGSRAISVPLHRSPAACHARLPIRGRPGGRQLLGRCRRFASRWSTPSSLSDDLGRVRRVKAKPADAGRFASLDTAATATGRQLRGGRGRGRDRGGG